eukprot:EC716417.1.p2 GENE.EC716417.1~~EC716417.1.p2  ORF type:complete len:122 (+),score=10.10 EC716417.1:263-628(+)
MSFVPCKPSRLPSVLWERAVLSDFSDTRERLRYLRSATHAQSHLHAQTTHAPLPHVSDAQGWRAFCCGPASDAAQQQTMPLLHIVLRLDSTTTTRVFAYHVEWLQEEEEILDPRQSLGCTH